MLQNLFEKKWLNKPTGSTSAIGEHLLNDCLRHFSNTLIITLLNYIIFTVLVKGKEVILFKCFGVFVWKVIYSNVCKRQLFFVNKLT